MAINIDSTTDQPEVARKQMEAVGTVVEEVKEEAVVREEPKPKEGETTEERKPEKEEVPKEEKTPKKEGAPKEEEDWDSLPPWAKKQVNKLREKNRELRDRLQDERVEKPSVSADRSEKKLVDDPTKAEGFTYCGRPKPIFADFEKADDPYAAFAEATGEWHADEKIAKRDAEAYAREQATLYTQIEEAFEQRKEEAATLVEDFDETLEEATEIIASPAMIQVIKTSEVGAHILYRLAKNPDECKRIHDLPPAAAIKAMGRLEAKVETEVETLKKGASRKEPPKKKAASSAPAPETPIRGGAPKTKTLAEMAGSDERVVEAPIKFDRNYEKVRNEQRRNR